MNTYWQELVQDESNKEWLLDELLLLVALDVLRSKNILSSIHMTSFRDGRIVAEAIQILERQLEAEKEAYKEAQRIEREAFEASATEEEIAEKKWKKPHIPLPYNREVLSVLAYSKDEFVQELTDTFVSKKKRRIAQAHRLQVNTLEESRTHRFIQEIS